MPSFFGKDKKKQQQQQELEAALQAIRDAEDRERRLKNEAAQRKLDEELAEVARMKWQINENERIKREHEEEKRIHQEYLRKQEGLAKKVRENERISKLRQRSPEAMRRLRQLIRTRYQLDCNIWVLRSAQEADHDLMYQDMVKSDAILNEILAIVNSWDENEWDPEDWALAVRIKEKLAEPVKRLWQENPPWQEGILV